MSDLLLTTVGFGTLLVLPFQPAAPLNERLVWNTYVGTAHAGAEQRIQLLTAPRQRLDMDIPVPTGSGMGGTFPMTYGGVKLPWAVPIWQDAALVGAISGGAGTLTVDTTLADFRAPGLALVWESAQKWRLVEVSAVAAGSLTLTDTIPESYAAAFVMPVRVGYPDGGIRTSTDGFNTAISLSFAVDEGKDLAPAAPEQYAGNDVYWDPPLLTSGGLEDAFSTRVDVLDSETGPISRYSPWTFNRNLRRLQWIGEDRAAAWAIRLWLHRRLGRCRAFWMPTHQLNLRPLNTGAVTTSLTVAGLDHPQLVPQRSRIAVKLTDGSWKPRKITNAAPDGLGNTVLTLDSSLATMAAAISAVSYLGLYRMNDDGVTLNWPGNGVVIMNAPVLEIEG